MRSSRIQRHVALFVFACAVTLPMSPVLAAGGAGRGTTDDRRGGQDDRRGVEVVFTKWVTNYPNMAGLVSGDVGGGQFVGEILNYSHTTTIDKIEALYHLNGGTHQMTAHVFVTQNNLKNIASIRGVVVDGPLTGAHVRGEYQVVYPCGAINAASSGDFCFQGTLDIGPVPED